MSAAGGPETVRPEIGLGDAVRVSAILGLDVASAMRVLRMPVLAPAGPGDPGPAPETGADAARPAADEDAIEPAADETPEPPGPPSRLDAVVPPTRERPPAPVIRALPAGPRRSGPPVRLPPVDEVLAAPEQVALADSSLLPPARHRAVLAALCRTTGPGDLDIPEIVRRLARAEPVDRLPTKLVPTMRRGVQVLVDLGPGMRPFLGDQRAVVAALRRLVGQEGLEVLRFAGSPLDGAGAGPGPVWTWCPYRPPIDDRRVLVLSDLGAGPGHPDRMAVWSRWLRFAAMFRRLERPMVALVPVPPGRLPDEVRARIPMVTWDRSTRVADAARAAGTATRGRRRWT